MQTSIEKDQPAAPIFGRCQGDQYNNLSPPSPSTILRVPDLAGHYMLKRSSLYSPARHVARDDWLLSFGVVPVGIEPAVRRADFTLLCAVAWPHTPAEFVDDIIDLAEALFVQHLLHDNPPLPPGGAATPDHQLRSLDEARRSLQSGFTAGIGLFEPIFANIWKRLRLWVSTEHLDLLVEAIDSYLSARQEAISCANSLLHGSLDDYLEVRGRHVAQRVDQLMVEMSLGITLSVSDRHHPAVVALNELDIRRTIYIQDLLSLRRELRQGQNMNVVLCLANKLGGLQAAIDAAYGLYIQTTSAFDQAYSSLQKPAPHGTALQNPQDVLRYAEGLRDFSAGLVDWTTHSPEYQ